MPFLDHLEELRWRIIWSLVAVVVGTVAGWFLVTGFDVLALLVRPIEPLLGDSRLGYLSPMDPFFVTLKLAVTLGLVLAFPVIVYQVWIFLAPALMPREKRAIVPALYLGLVLFLVGVAVAYFGALPIALKFGMGFQTGTLEQNIIIGPYLTLVVRILLAFGIVFELPVVILVLAVLGVVDSKMLARGRRWALVLITIGASLLTPGDIVTTIFLMVPLLVLYEVSILMARLVERKGHDADEAAEAGEEEAGQWAGA